MGEPLGQMTGLTPRLASWDGKTHPNQVRLQAYLADVEQRSAGWPLPDQGLALHLTIDVGEPRRLHHGSDLENYLTPLVQRLGHRRFVFASAHKRVGGGSELLIGQARPWGEAPRESGWGAFACRVDRLGDQVSTKTDLRARLAASLPTPLPDGPVEVHLAWRCGSRNWVNLWKATGDTMGPVLGEPYAAKPFDPTDDRIVALSLHLNEAAAMGYAVDVGMWWRMAPAWARRRPA